MENVFSSLNHQVIGETMSENGDISKSMFTAGIIISILASSIISTLISTQWIQGVQGPQGIQGEQGPPGIVTIENFTGWLSKPAYDSGWVPIQKGTWTSFQHNLSTNELFVYMLGSDILEGIYAPWDDRARWRSTSENEISIYARYGIETFDTIRVMIWNISES